MQNDDILHNKGGKRGNDGTLIILKRFERFGIRETQWIRRGSVSGKVGGGIRWFVGLYEMINIIFYPVVFVRIYDIINIICELIK